jgi:propanediol dehydratase small subunit
MTRTAFSGLSSDAITIDAARSGDLGPDDVRISADTLAVQATVAECHENPQLAENFRRAAELVGFTDEELMRLYETLRPRRATAEELHSLAASLTERGAVRNAALVREAAAVYARRGLLR